MTIAGHEKKNWMRPFSTRRRNYQALALFWGNSVNLASVPPAALQILLCEARTVSFMMLYVTRCTFHAALLAAFVLWILRLVVAIDALLTGHNVRFPSIHGNAL